MRGCISSALHCEEPVDHALSVHLQEYLGDLMAAHSQVPRNYSTPEGEARVSIQVGEYLVPLFRNRFLELEHSFYLESASRRSSRIHSNVYHPFR